MEEIFKGFPLKPEVRKKSRGRIERHFWRERRCLNVEGSFWQKTVRCFFGSCRKGAFSKSKRKILIEWSMFLGLSDERVRRAETVVAGSDESFSGGLQLWRM